MSLKLEDIRISEEYEKLVPPLTDKQYRQLKQSIDTEGLLLPIIINKEGVILDGHHRYKACKELGTPPRFRIKEFENKTDEVIFVGECNLQRRHLTPIQRIEITENLRPHYEERAKKNLIDAGKGLTISSKVNTRKELAEKAKVSEDTYNKGIHVLKEASLNDIESLRDEKKSINSVYKQLNMKQKNLKPQNLPQEKFDLIYIDPPWESVSGSLRGASEPHYNTMSFDNIKEIKLPMFDNCVVFLWTINSLTTQTVKLLEAWNLQYRSKIIWDKEIQGTGYWVRTQHEELWVCTKGKVPVPDPSVVSRSVYREKRTSHSKKPEHFYELIESYYPARKKLEMFARNKRQGWQSWGNEL